MPRKLKTRLPPPNEPAPSGPNEAVTESLVAEDDLSVAAGSRRIVDDQGGELPITGIPDVTNPTTASQAHPDQLPTASPGPRRPIERLASLNLGRRAPKQISEPRNLDALDAPFKTLKFQPKSAIRRSKEEREATERAEAARLHARFAASTSSTSTPFGRGGFRGRGNATGAFGGASSRWLSERYAGTGAGGFLGGITPAEDRRQKEKSSTKSRGVKRSSMLSGTPREANKAEANPEVKKESNIGKGKTKDEEDDGDDVVGPKSRRKPVKVKKEPGGSLEEVSDDDLLELEPARRRINIEHINLISDEESPDDLANEGDKGKERERDKQPRSLGSSLMRPIRIDRHEHIERTIGVNTEASSLTSAELRKRAKARGEAQGSLFLPEDKDLTNDKPTRGKGKNKVRDVEFLRHERKWQGVYQDEEDDDDIPRHIKQEPHEHEDAMIVDDEEQSTGIALTQDVLSGHNEYLLEPTPGPFPRSSTSSKPPSLQNSLRKRKHPKALSKRKPILQTQEDHEEWQRYKDDISLIRNELLFPASQIDDDGDVVLPAADQVKRDKKEGLVYLFQLPPILPTIQDPRKLSEGKVKRKPKPMDESENHPAESSTIPESNTKDSKASLPLNKAPVKSEPLAHPSATTGITAGPLPYSASSTTNYALSPSSSSPPFPIGQLGTLSLDAEGFPSATWSNGFQLALGRANDYGALQEVVLLSSPGKADDQENAAVKKEGEKAAQGEEGVRCGEEAWAVGQMGGGFVMTPDWGQMFGG
ncbi:MAG: hypothetical protein Q9220_000702 [cf. Caloplaca sp. 1 TL-2023]